MEYEFKVGDIVEVDGINGKGKIVYIDTNAFSFYYFVAFEEGKMRWSWCENHMLKKVEDKPTFKVGDIVKIKEGSESSLICHGIFPGHARLIVGRKFKIINIDDYNFYINFSDFCRNYYIPHFLCEKVEEEKQELKVEVGKYYKTRIGEIEYITNSCGSFSFPFMGRAGRTYKENGKVFNYVDTPNDLIEELPQKEIKHELKTMYVVYNPFKDSNRSYPADALSGLFTDGAFYNDLEEAKKEIKINTNNEIGMDKGMCAIAAIDYIVREVNNIKLN